MDAESQRLLDDLDVGDEVRIEADDRIIETTWRGISAPRNNHAQCGLWAIALDSPNGDWREIYPMFAIRSIRRLNTSRTA